jgi:predicted ATPase
VISSLGIRNFKRFRAVDLAFRSMTVLTGLNGTGKSSLIQTILLARQIAEKPRTPVVQLNGPHGLALGDSQDVLHFDAEGEEIEINVRCTGVDHRYSFSSSAGRYPHLHVAHRPDAPPAVLARTGPAFVYLMAERLGPRDFLSVTSVETEHIGVGEQGQYTAQVLAEYETKTVRAKLRHPDTEHNVTTLRTQVEAWASYVISPVQISAQWPPGLSVSVLRFQEPGLMSEPIRPANIGFGFSYALPVLVAGLLAPEGGLLLVENPEAHLHPAGQSRLGSFLARVAGDGVQVVVETHSDHIVNGIRLAVAEERIINSNDVIVHFFGKAGDGQPISIDLTEAGRLSAWPEGFFDQIETDLGRLARARRDQR